MVEGAGRGSGRLRRPWAWRARQLAAPVLAAAFGTAAVAVIGGPVAAVAMLVPLLVSALRRIEINRGGLNGTPWRLP